MTADTTLRIPAIEIDFEETEGITIARFPDARAAPSVDHAGVV